MSAPNEIPITLSSEELFKLTEVVFEIIGKNRTRAQELRDGDPETLIAFLKDDLQTRALKDALLHQATKPRPIRSQGPDRSSE